MAEQPTITLVNENGEEKELEILYIIEAQEIFEKDFFVTAPTGDEEEKELVFLSVVPTEDEGEIQVELVTDPEQWMFVQESFADAVLSEGGSVEESVVKTEEE